MPTDEDRTALIVSTLRDAFGPLMEADPAAFRSKYRKMANDPHAFYRGTACLFYADATRRSDAFADEQADRIWIHGDLHVENFGTYLSSNGRLVFDINDFDEAYVGRFVWDLERFAASLALLGWQKALPLDDVRGLIERYLRCYLEQVDHYAGVEDDDDFSLQLHNTDGPILTALQVARRIRRADLLGGQTAVDDDGERHLVGGPTVRRLDDEERERVLAAFDRYLQTIPASKRFDRSLFYEVHDVVGKSGFGIGSAGLPAYTFLVEGHSEALDNDVLLSMKQANVPALSRFVESGPIEEYFDHEGHRTVVSQRALQVHTDPLLGHTEIDGVGFVVAEVSPYEVDLEWDDLTDPEEITRVVEQLGRATAKIHCASDEDSDQDLVDFQVEDAIVRCVDGRRDEFVEHVVDFGIDYSRHVREDHALFVEAFREGKVGVSPT